MSGDLLVSVVIPTYGRPELLGRAIDSVLAQTHKNIEIFVVDDNDSNTVARKETEDLMLIYAHENRVKYLRHEHNKNGAAARNTGMKEASGKYITFLDDDDEMLPNRIECCVAALEAKDESWAACYTDFTKYKANGKKTSCGETRSGDLYFEALARSLYIGSGSNLFLRMKAVREVGGYDEDFRRNQDLEFMARVLEHNKILFVPETTFIVHYEDSRRKADTLTKTQKYKNIVDIDEFYLSKFASRIDALPIKQRKKIYSVVALERLRYSVRFGMVGDALKNCIRNRVSFILFVRYCGYIVKRAVTGKTYGFWA